MKPDCHTGQGGVLPGGSSPWGTYPVAWARPLGVDPRTVGIPALLSGAG